MLHSDKSFSVIEPYIIELINSNTNGHLFCYIIDHAHCYFYILNHSNDYIYKGEGKLWNETLGSYNESQTERTKPGYVMIKALESGIECAVSGLNGANYNIHEFQHVYFARSEGDHILRFLNNSNKIMRYQVKSGRGYFVINSEKCVDMETNRELPLFLGQDVIEMEAKHHFNFIKERSGKIEFTSI